MYKEFPSLGEAFLNYFDVDLATSETQLEKVGHVRYRVYCEEFGWFAPEAFPNEREIDLYDDSSLHCLITHRRSKRSAGCVRLICASEEHDLPLEAHCRESIYLDYLQSLSENRTQICEFSRLAVDPAFRRRPGEKHTQFGEFDALDCCHQELRTFSLIGITSLIAACALAEITQRKNIFAMMDPTLPRLLRRVGILLQDAGDLIDYHGKRSLYFVSTDAAIENMREDLRRLYDVIYERLAYSYHNYDSAKLAYA